MSWNSWKNDFFLKLNTFLLQGFFAHLRAWTPDTGVMNVTFLDEGLRDTITMQLFIFWLCMRVENNFEK